MIINNIKDTQVKTNGWIVSVKHEPWSDAVVVYITFEDAKGIHLCNFEQNGNFEVTDLKEGQSPPEPTMKLNRDVWEGLKQAINGIEPMPEIKAVDAELKATKYHLEDVRKLLKLK